MRMSRIAPWIVLAAGCAHHGEPIVVATVEAPDTIQASLTADTARLQPPGDAPSSEAGVAALSAVIESQLSTVGQLRPPKGDVVSVELPAPGWALRARIRPQPELMCQVILEPLALAPNEHPVSAAPWSVQDALDRVRRALETLRPANTPPMEPARFARLRGEAGAAARAGTDPPLTPSEFVRTPRPIRSEGTEAPYYAPAGEPAGGLGKERDLKDTDR